MDSGDPRFEASAKRAGSLGESKSSEHRNAKRHNPLTAVFHHHHHHGNDSSPSKKTKDSDDSSTVTIGRKPRPSGASSSVRGLNAEGGPGGMQMMARSTRSSSGGQPLEDDESGLSSGGDSTSAFSGATSTWEKIDATLDTAPLVRHHPTHDHDPPTNLLTHPLPPSDISQFSDHAMQQFTIHFVFLATMMGLLIRYDFHFAIPVIVAGVGIFGLRRRIEAMRDEFGFDTERKRARHAKEESTTGESVEWINALIEVIWPLVSTDILKAGIDLLEDTLQAQSPGFVNSVRVDDVDLGRNAMRLLSMKVLPADQPIVDKQPSLPDEPGDYVNIECEFAYRRAPPPAPKSTNAHFLAYFGVGIKKLAHFEMPVWIQLEGLYGRIRLRLQLIADPPFVRYTTFTFPKLPTVEIAAKALHSFNVMSLPLISNFVTHSIDIVLAGFVAPASYTLDLSRMLLGSDVMMKPRNTGVLAIAIHRAEDLISADVNGYSDPYVSLSFSRFAKPLYATRIIERTLSPHWEELAFLRVSPDDVAESEKVRFTVWDSDRVSADDPLGKVEIGLPELVQHPGKIWSMRSEELQAYHPGYKVGGRLTFSIGYFTYLKTVPTSQSADLPMPAGIATSERTLFTERQTELEDEEGGSSPAHRYGERMRAALDGKVPPSVETRSGMLVIQIHQIANLEVPGTREHVGRHKKGENLEHGSVPSTYTHVIVNDQKVYETRVKRHMTDPYINAGTERFIRDWPRTRVDIVVVDARLREKDAIVGVVSLVLADVLAARSQVTRWYPLVGGLGYGRMRASVLFKAIGVDIERPLRGWDVGTLEIWKIQITGLAEEVNGVIEASIMTSGTIPKVVTEASVSEPTLHEGHFSTSAWSMNWTLKPRLRLPVVTRMQSSLCLVLKSQSGLMSRKDVQGGAVAFLNGVVDGEVTTLDLELDESDGSTSVTRMQQCEREVKMPANHPMGTTEKEKARRAPGVEKGTGGKAESTGHGSKKGEGQHKGKKEKKERASADLQRVDSEGGKGLTHTGSSHSLGAPPDRTPSTLNRGDTHESHTGASRVASQISDPAQDERIDPSPNKGASEMTPERSRIRVTLRFVPGIGQAHQSLMADDPALEDVYRAWRTTTRSKERVDGKGLVQMMGQQADRHRPDVAEEKILSRRKATGLLPPGGFSPPKSGANSPRRFVKDSPGGASSGHSPNSSRPNSRRSSLIAVAGGIRGGDGSIGEWTDDGDWEDENGEGGAKKRKKRWLGLKKGSAAEKESDVMYQRGASSVKAVRTLTWMKDSAKTGVKKMTKPTRHRGPQSAVEKEYISSIG